MMHNVEIGSKVIVRSNEQEPYAIGVLVAYQSFNGGREFPIVRYDDGREFLCFAAVFQYSDLIKRVFDTLSYEEQWQLVVAMRNKA